MNPECWNPFGDMEAIFKAGSGTYCGNEPLAVQGWRPLVDIRDNETHVEIKIDVPAVRAKDVQVDVKDPVLTVRLHRRDRNGSR